MEVFSFAKRKFKKIPLQRVSPDSCSSSPLFSRRYFAFWHSCLSERKHPILTSYSRNPQLPPSDFEPFCRMNRYLERFSLPHTQPFAAVRQIACRIRTYGITLVSVHAFPFLPDNACRLRLPRIWNPSFISNAGLQPPVYGACTAILIWVIPNQHFKSTLLGGGHKKSMLCTLVKMMTIMDDP